MFQTIKDLQNANVQIEPVLIRRLLNAQDALQKLKANLPQVAKSQKANAQKVTPRKKQPGDNEIMQGLAALAIAAPIVSLKGLPAALNFIAKHSLPKLNQGLKKAKLHAPKLQPKPGLRPRLRAF